MRPAVDVPALQHVFVPGLRFDTELHFRMKGRGGRGIWRPLPTPEVSAVNSAWVALMQAEALLTGKVPSRQAMARATRADRADRAGALPVTQAALRACVSEFIPELQARWHSGQSAVASGDSLPGLALACLLGPDDLHWALVTGMEIERGAGPGPPRALLLLDSRRAGPWGTGYNARLLIEKNRWQGLDGEVQANELVGLLELQRLSASH